MSGNARVLTFQDMMSFYNSGGLLPDVSPDDSVFAKSMFNVGSGGTGVWNAIYGAQVWYQLNTEANLFGLLPKLSWDKSGFRTVTAYPGVNGTVNGVVSLAGAMAIAETGTLPTPAIATINTVKLTPKINVNTFETTQVLEQLAKLSQDDIMGNLDSIRALFATTHVKFLNQQINQVVVGTSSAGVQSGVGINALESIDRIVASWGEATTAAGVIGTVASNAVSPYNGAISRTAASSYDAQVVAPSGTLGVGAVLTDYSLRQIIQKCRTAGGFNNVFVTGYDTLAELQGLYLSNWRTVSWGEARVQAGLNGIKAADGVNTGVSVASLYGIPLISAVDTPLSQTNGTTSAGVENIYLLDTTDTEGYGDARLGMQILNPTNYLETSARDFILLGYLAYEGAYATIGELACRFPAAQGKIRDCS